MVRFFAILLRPLFKVLDFLTPLGDLAARAWVAWIFFQAGLVKIQAWEATKFLFEHTYQVPFLNPMVAAVVGTGAELILPVLLLLGLGGRLMIVIFFIYNAVATISYPHLWSPEGAVSLAQHISWGLLLALLMFHGPGKLSLDYLIKRRHGQHLQRPAANDG